MENLKFKYMDKVVVVDGFYKGTVGIVERVFDSGMLEKKWDYLVKLKEGIGVWISEDLLQLKEE